MNDEVTMEFGSVCVGGVLTCLRGFNRVILILKKLICIAW